MSAEDLAALRNRWFIRLLEEVNEGQTVCAMQTIRILPARHRHLFRVFAQLYARLAIDFRQLRNPVKKTVHSNLTKWIKCPNQKQSSKESSLI